MTTAIEDKREVKPEIMNDPSIFSFNGGIEIFAGDGQTDKNNIRLTLYDGSIVKHWYWGNLAFELSTMKLAKAKIPILDAHNTDRPLGYSTGASFAGKFTLDGRLLKGNALATKRKEEMEEGFPYEASLRFDTEKTKIELIRENESTQVNGQTLAGPGAVMRNTVIMEGSICVFGALGNCKTENFENVLERFSEREKPMQNTETKMTIESFEKDQPEIFKQIFDKGTAAGEKAERDYFDKLIANCGGDSALLAEMHKAGKSPEEALTERNVRLEKHNKELTELAAKNAGKKVDPAMQEFSDTQKADENKKPAGEKTEEQLKADFATSKDLQEEFGDVKNYLAYIKADKNGQVNLAKPVTQ